MALFIPRATQSASQQMKKTNKPTNRQDIYIWQESQMEMERINIDNICQMFSDHYILYIIYYKIVCTWP